MNENQLQRLREYVDNHANARRDAAWEALCQAFGTSSALCAMCADLAFACLEEPEDNGRVHGKYGPEPEVANELRRWSAVACGDKSAPHRHGVRDQFGTWYMVDRWIWTSTRENAQAKARELNKEAASGGQ